MTLILLKIVLILSYYNAFKIPPHPPRLHYAIQAYKELLIYIQRMSLSEDPTLRDSAKVIHNNIFYYPVYGGVFITLLRNFCEVIQAKACLRDIIEATHIFVQQMERYSAVDCLLLKGDFGVNEYIHR